MTIETEKKIREVTRQLRELLSNQTLVKRTVEELRKVLTEKNKRYGDSALSPMKVFSKLGSRNGLYLRADDKLSRIHNADTLRKNDVADLMGYCVLICIENDWTDWSELID